MCLPCCNPFADVYLEDPPKKKEAKKKEEEKKEYIFVNDDAVFYPNPFQPTKMSWFTYVPPKAAAPAPEAPKAPKYYYDYSKPAQPAAAPAPEPAKQHPYPVVGHVFFPLATPSNTSQTYPHQPNYAPQPQLHYPAAPAAPAAPAPAVHNAWHGKTKAEVDAENLAIAQRVGATKPTQLVPYEPSPEQQFWCRELDTSYTLRTSKDITENLQPGFWQYAPGGYPYWVRTEKK